MTAPGPAQPTPGTPASPAPGAPAAPTTPTPGSQVNPPLAPQQPVPPQPVPQQPSGPPLAPAPVPPAQPPVPASAQTAAPVAAAPAPAPAAPPPPAPPAAPPPAAAPPAAAAPAKGGPPPKTKKAKAASGGGGGYLVAVFALIIAVIAAGTAVYSLKISMDLRDGNSSAPLAEATPTPDASAPTEAPPSTEPTPTPTEDEPTGPEYTAELVRVALEVPNPTGCTAAYVDVDTGSIGVQNGHEFYLSRCQNPSTLRVHVDRTSGRSTSNDDPSAEECAALVAGTPTSELVLEAEAGLTFCLITNRAQATAASLPQRLAIIEVLSVTTSQVRLALSTFRIED